MKQFWIQLVALLIVAFAALIFTFNPSFLTGLVGSGTNSGTTSNTSSATQLKIGNTVLSIELADTKDKRSQGLSNRDSLASDSGMLFSYSTAGQYSYWMKDMKFPLDFIWINNNKVVDLTQNVPIPQPNQTPDTLPIYQANSPVDKVLEVNAGFIASHNIKVGDVVSLIGE